MNNPRDICTQYLFDLYSNAFNALEGTIAEKHCAGLLAVVDGTQPNVVYPRAPKPKVGR